MELNNVFQTIKRWLWLIITIVVLTSVILVLRLMFADPVYAGRVKIQISAPQNESVTAFDENRSVSQRELTAIARNNFTEILVGDEVHNRTVEILNLSGKAIEFEPEISLGTDSDFINLYVEAETPEMAKDIANTLVDEAISYYGDLRAKPTEEEKALYAEQTRIAEEEYNNAEGAFTMFLAENNITTLDSDINIAKNLLEQLQIERDQRLIQNDVADPLTQIEQLITDRQFELDRLLELEPNYATLQENVISARQNYQRILENYTAGALVESAEEKNKAAQDAFIEFKTENNIVSLYDEIEIITRSLQQLELERDRQSYDGPQSLQQIDSLIAQRQAEVDRLQKLQPEYTSLENRLHETADNYQHVLDKYYEADLKTTVIREANFIQVVEPAGLPEEPVNNALKLIVLGLIGSGGFSVILAFVLDYFFVVDEPFTVGRTVPHAILDLPVLGLAPETNNVRFEPESVAAESMRQVRARAHFSAPQSSLKTFLITSAQPGDGKSTITGNLSFALESGNKKVLVIDADLRKSSLHTWFEMENSSGLSELLRADPETLKKDLLEYIQPTDYPGVFLLSSGQKLQDPAFFLGSPNLTNLLEILSNKFDFIVIDSPPILSVPDTLLIAKTVDGVILVASPGKTMKNALEEAVTTLRSQPEIKILGITLNRANQNDYYGYYYIPQTKTNGFFERISNGFYKLRNLSSASKINDKMPPMEASTTNGRENRQTIQPTRPQNQSGSQTEIPIPQKIEAAIAPSRIYSLESNDSGSDEEAIRADIPEIAFSTPLGKLQIPSQKINALAIEGYATVGDLMLQMALDPDEILALKGFGPKSLSTIRTALDEFKIPEQGRQQEFDNIERERIEEETFIKEALVDEAIVYDDKLGIEYSGPNGNKNGALHDGLEILSKLAVQMPTNVSKFLGSRVSARIIARRRWKKQVKTYSDE